MSFSTSCWFGSERIILRIIALKITNRDHDLRNFANHGEIEIRSKKPEDEEDLMSCLYQEN